VSVPLLFMIPNFKSGYQHWQWGFETHTVWVKIVGGGHFGPSM